MKYFILTFMALLCTDYLHGQDTTVVSLEKAVRLGYNNSKDLKISESKIDEAKARLASARQKFFPTVDISGSYLRVNNPSVTAQFNPLSNGEQQNNNDNTPPDISQAALAQVSVSQPLFAGLKIRNYAESANYVEQAAHLDAENQKSEIVYNVIGAYFDLYKLYSTQKTIEQGLEQSKRRVRDFINLEKNGLITHNDLLRAQLQQSKMELALTEIENQIEVANFQMDILLGLPDQTFVRIDSSSIPEMVDVAQPLEDYTNAYTDHRMDLLASKKLENAANFRLKAAKGDYYPSLALTGGYVDIKVPGLITVVNAMNVGVGLKYSISGIFDAHHMVEEAKAVEHQSELKTAILNDQIRTEIFTAYSNYKKSLKTLETLNIASKQALENYRVTKNSYENNTAILSDLLEAEVSYLQAQLNMQNSKTDAEKSYYMLEKASGLLVKDFTIQQN